MPLVEMERHLKTQAKHHFMNTTTATPSFRRSAECEALIKSMKDIQEGVQITYKSLQTTCGLPDGIKFHAVLVSARRVLQREMGIVLAVVRGIGLIRCAPSEIVALGQSSITKSRKVAKRGLKQILCADTKRLKPDEMRDFNMRSSVLALMTFTGSRGTQLKLGQEVEDAHKRFEPSDAIKLLQSGV